MKFLDWFSARSRLTLALLTLGALLAIAIVTCTLALRAPEGSEQAAAQRDMMPRGTLLTLTTRYTGCEHADARTEALVCDGEGVDRTGLEALYPDWQVLSFSSDGAALSRTLDAPCSRHCVLRLDGSRLTICRLQDGQLHELGSATISRETLDPELIAQLEAGYLTDTLAQAEAFIEGIES